jgi:hypothetical protein
MDGNNSSQLPQDASSDTSASALIGKRLNMSQFMSATRVPPKNPDLVPMQSGQFAETRASATANQHYHRRMDYSMHQEHQQTRQESNNSNYVSLRERSGTQDSVPPPPQYENAPAPQHSAANMQRSGDIRGHIPVPQEFEAQTIGSRSESPDSVLSSTIPTNEKDFLNYLTQFQEEIRRLQYKP